MPRHLLPPEHPEPLGARLTRLMDEARAAARDHVGELEEALARVTRLSADVAEGGAAYPVGVRAVCRDLQRTAEAQTRSLRGFHAEPVR